MTDSSKTAESDPKAGPKTDLKTDPISSSSNAPRSTFAGSSREPSGSTTGSLFDIPKMGAEVGYQAVDDDDVPPLRASGLVCLVLGVLSFSALVAWQMLILPIAAIVFGVIAMRRWSGRRPMGTSAAVIGLVLACGFGAAGVAIPMAKRMTIGEQGTYFAREFLTLVGKGDVELASELRKEARNRHVKEMNLVKAYQEQQLKRQGTDEETADEIFESIAAAGPDIPWELAEAPRVFVKYNMERVDTLWIDPSGKFDEKVQVEMQWTPDETTGVGNWHVNLFQFYRELIVAPSVL